MNNRNIALDIAKGIGIILVVLGHNWSVLREEGEVYRIIFSFHIPLFLFISGLFLKDDDSLGRFTASRADALLKPFLGIALLVCILRVFGVTDHSPNTASGFVFFIQMLYSTRGYITLEWLPLWYLPYLFLALFFSKGILQSTIKLPHRQNWIVGIIILLLAFGIWFANTIFLTNPRLPFTSDMLPVGTAILLIGFLLKGRVQAMTFSLPLFLSSVFAFSLLHYFFNDTIDLGARIYSDPVISTLQAGLGTYMVLSISLLLKQVQSFSRFLVYMGTASLFIMMFHNFAQVNVYWGLLQWGYGDLPSNTMSFIAGVGFPIILWEIAKRQRFLSRLFLPITL